MPSSPSDLFVPIVAEDRFHPNFLALMNSPFHAHARSLMNAFYSRMGDPNGNYVRDFQGNGFHARLFELASFAYLESAGFQIDRSHDMPDFLVSRAGLTLAVEVATANPTAGQGLDISFVLMEELSDETLERKVMYEFPRRMLAVLKKKLRHDTTNCRTVWASL